MTNLNVVVFQGNLTRDPETRFSQAGNAIVNFGVAINSGFGEKEEVTFVDVVAFGKQGEALAKHFTKGKQILVQGRLRQERWDDKNTGQKRSKMTVILEAFHFVSGPRPEGASVPVATETPAAEPAGAEGDGKLF